MFEVFRQWQSRRRLRRLIRDASRIIYSENSDFEGLVSQLKHRSGRLEEIHVAIEAVFNIEKELGELVTSKSEIRDEDVIKQIMNESLSTLRIIETQSDPEVVHVQKEMCAAKAQHAFSSLEFMFAWLSLECEESFPGACYKGGKLKQGPLSLKERKNFKRLAATLQEANAKLEAIDEELSAAARNQE